MPDIDLILWRKVKSGDKEAFELLFKKYYSLLCLFSRRFTGNLDTSRELVQDLFIFLWENKAELEISAIKGYLLQAVRYNSIRRIKHDRQLLSIDNISLKEEDSFFYDHLEYAELQEKMLEAISSLSDQCKKVFLLSRYQQLKYSEIAQKLNISVKTVEAHISKALKEIHIYLENSFLCWIILFSLL